MRVSVDGDVELVVPSHGSLSVAEKFLHSRTAWILRAIDKQRTALRNGTRIAFDHGARIPFLDTELLLNIETGSRSRVRLLDGMLHVMAPTTARAAAIEGWYRSEAQAFFEQEVKRYTAMLGVRYGRITVKDQKTVWGSCSKMGNLNFSWRLLMTPRAVASYVAAHECAHLLHLDHSRAFWHTVERICPSYRTQRTWLRVHGRRLR